MYNLHLLESCNVVKEWDHPSMSYWCQWWLNIPCTWPKLFDPPTFISLRLTLFDPFKVLDGIMMRIFIFPVWPNFELNQNLSSLGYIDTQPFKFWNGYCFMARSCRRCKIFLMKRSNISTMNQFGRSVFFHHPKNMEQKKKQGCQQAPRTSIARGP